MKTPAGKRFSIRERARSFRFAFRGLLAVFLTQHNFRIHLAALLLVVILGFTLKVSLIEWCILLIASALVLSLEIINTAIEYLVDLLSPEFNTKAGLSKDLGAAAVLLSAVFAAICGTLIFGRHLIIIIFP